MFEEHKNHRVDLYTSICESLSDNNLILRRLEIRFLPLDPFLVKEYLFKGLQMNCYL
jgi:hypothetical protein